LSQLIAPNFSSVPTVLKQFFTWNATGDVDLCLSNIFLRKAVAVEEETK